MKWTEKRQRDYLEDGYWKHLHQARIEWLADRIRSEQCDVLCILDVGCGDSVITKRLRDAFPRAIIHAVDMDPVRLGRASAYCKKVAFCHGDATALPFDAAAFDVVLCHHVIEHIQNDIQVLRECRRVLRPGGLLLLGAPQENAWLGRMVRRLHPRLYAEGEHVNFYTIADLRRRLERCGFSRIEHRVVGFLFPWYYVHVLLVWNRLTFRIGDVVSQYWEAGGFAAVLRPRRGDVCRGC